MKKIIVNADDFGFSEAVNYGIIKAHEKGIVSSTSLMANMPGFEHAVELLKKYPHLHVGVHLNITCGKPVLSTHSTIGNETGYFTHGKEHEYQDEEIYAELCAQIEKIKDAGVSIDHLDSHHHIHTEARFQNVIQKILETYPLPIRGGFEYENTYPLQSKLCTEFYDTGVCFDTLNHIMETCPANDVVDIMCHPAYLDDILVDFSSYRMQRIAELRILCAPETKAALSENNIHLGSYAEMNA